MTTSTPTIRDLEARSPACRELRHRIMEGLGLQPLPAWDDLVPRRPINLDLCSSCEVGSHQLCARRIATNGWRPAMECKCLCRFAGEYDELPGHD